MSSTNDSIDVLNCGYLTNIDRINIWNAIAHLIDKVGKRSIKAINWVESKMFEVKKYFEFQSLNYSSENSKFP